MNFDVAILRSKLPECTICYLDQCESTNALLMRNTSDYSDMTFAITLNQTNGRGRHSRNWICPSGDGIAMSLLIKQADVSLPISLIAGVAVVRALDYMNFYGSSLKWPNDIIMGGKKLGGILCETKYGSTVSAVIGIGINMRQGNTFFEQYDLTHATSLYAWHGKYPDSVELAANIAANFLDLYRSYEVSTFINEYSSRCITLNSEVTGNGFAGIATAITLAGELVVDCQGKMLVINSGEVGVRSLY